jgi:hypothetical protein
VASGVLAFGVRGHAPALSIRSGRRSRSLRRDVRQPRRSRPQFSRITFAASAPGWQVTPPLGCEPLPPR